MKKGLAKIDLYPADLIQTVYQTGEHPMVTGARVLLWCIAATADRDLPIGYLPADENVLMRWSRLTLEEWKIARPLIVGGWSLDARRNAYKLRRIIEQNEAKHRVASVRSEAGRMGGRPTVGEKANAKQMLLPPKSICSPPTPTPTPTPNSEFRESSRKKTPSSRKRAGEAALSASSNGSPDPKEVQQLLDHYLHTMPGRHSYDVSDEQRKRILKIAFKEFDLDTLKNVITVFATSPKYAHHRGENDTGKRYDGLCEYILKGPHMGVISRIEDILREGGFSLETPRDK